MFPRACPKSLICPKLKATQTWDIPTWGENLWMCLKFLPLPNWRSKHWMTVQKLFLSGFYRIKLQKEILRREYSLRSRHHHNSAKVAQSWFTWVSLSLLYFPLGETPTLGCRRWKNRPLVPSNGHQRCKLQIIHFSVLDPYLEQLHIWFIGHFLEFFVYYFEIYLLFYFCCCCLF